MRGVIDLLIGVLLGLSFGLLVLLGVPVKAEPNIGEMFRLHEQVLRNAKLKEEKMKFLNKQRLKEAKKLFETNKAKSIPGYLGRYKILKKVKNLKTGQLLLKGLGVANAVLLSIAVYCEFYDCKVEKEKEEGVEDE